MTINWENPKNDAPASSFTHAGPSKSEVLADLVNSPGRWAKLSSHTTRNAAAQVKRKLKKRHPSAEFRTEAQDDGRVALFAMYPGGGEQ